MKNIFFILLFIVCSLILKSQTYTQFNLLFTPFGYGKSALTNIVDMDSFYFVEGYSSSNYSKFIAKVNTSGNIIEKKQVPINSFECANKNENSFIRIGRKVYNSTYTIAETSLIKKIPTLIAFDNNLDTTLFIVYPDSIFNNSSNNNFVDIKLSNDSNIILLGNTNISALNPDNNRMFIMKADTLGNIIWLHIFPMEYKYAYHINVNSDCNYTVFVEKNRGSFVRIDSLGNIISELSINGLKAINHNSSLINIGDTVYLARTVFDSVNNNTTNSCLSLTKYNCITNSLLFDKVIIYPFPITMFAGQYNIKYSYPNIFVTSSMNIINSYNGNYYSLGYVPKLYAFNDLGNIIYSKQFYAVSFPTETINDFVLTNDNCILGIGSDDFDRKAWIFKSQSLLGLGFSDYYESNNIKVYPNPSSDFLNVDKSLINIINYEVYNSAGLLCIKEDRLNREVQIKISLKDLNSGVYFLILTSNDGRKYAKEFIKK